MTVFDFKQKLKLNPCVYIRGRQRSRFGGCGIVSVLGRVPAPPSRTFKDAPDPSSQGGVGNCNQQPPKSQDSRSDVLAQLAQPSAEVIFQLEGGLRTTVTGRER